MAETDDLYPGISHSWCIKPFNALETGISINSTLEADINWEWLAQQFRLTGGEIRAIAREAALYATADSSKAQLEMGHVIQACKAITGRRQKTGRSGDS